MPHEVTGSLGRSVGYSGRHPIKLISHWRLNWTGPMEVRLQ